MGVTFCMCVCLSLSLLLFAEKIYRGMPEQFSANAPNLRRILIFLPRENGERFPTEFPSSVGTAPVEPCSTETEHVSSRDKQTKTAQQKGSG
jgi:hypothetical protein